MDILFESKRPGIRRLTIRSNVGGIRWDYQVDISFESKRRGIRWNYQVGLTFRSKIKVSGGPIR